MTGSSSGSGPGSRCLDPHRVYELVIRRMPRELLDYLDSIPGASRDLHFQGVKVVGKALLHLLSEPLRPLSAEENRDIACWARLARFHATNSRVWTSRVSLLRLKVVACFLISCSPSLSKMNGYTMMANQPLVSPSLLQCTKRLKCLLLTQNRFRSPSSLFCAPQMVGNPSNLTSDAGPHMHTHNSSSYSGRMLTHAPNNIGPCMHLQNSSSYSRRMLNREHDSNELIHSVASSSRTPAANPVQEIVYDVHRHAALHNPLSASSSKIPDAMLPPVKANPSSAAPERRVGAPPLRKSTSRPSGAATSPPPRAVTSSPRTPVRLRRRLLPLHTCQRQILSVPELEVEQATSAPPPRGRALRLRGIDLGPYRQTIEGGRITYLKDPESDPKKFFWAKALESWPDDDV